MYFTSSSSSLSLGMEELSISIPQLNPLLPRFLEPLEFLLKEDLVVLLLELLLKQDKSNRVNSFKNPLNTLDPIFQNFLITKNMTKNIPIKGKGTLLNFPENI